MLDEVVVTALGIKRATKALSYNVQEVKGDELTTVKSANFMNSLAGKVAGVNINASSSGVGGATRVVMRGTKSISSDAALEPYKAAAAGPLNTDMLSISSGLI